MGRRFQDNITLDKMGKKESNALREIRKYRESEKIKSTENTKKKKPNLFENFIDKVKESENGATPDDLPSYDQFKGFDGNGAMPNAPQPPAFKPPQHVDLSTWNSSSTLSNEEALECLREHCKSLCCWGEGPIDKMEIVTIKPSFGYKYTIKTYSENRSIGPWKYEAYKGGPVDGEKNGPPPAPWDIKVQVPAPFRKQTEYIRIPHTENVRKCRKCCGRGENRCPSCKGGGYTQQPNKQKQKCGACHGSGFVKCSPCEGFGEKKHFLELKVDFYNHVDDYVYGTTDLPDKLILKARGRSIFEETADRIGPIINFEVNEVNENSSLLVQSHATKWPQERMWKQNHTLDSVPVFEVEYKIDDKTGRFLVYGEGALYRRVFSKDYPAQCCCCLNVPDCADNCSCCNSCCYKCFKSCTLL